MLLKDQERAKGILETLQKTKKYPNALLIEGPEGVGKTVCALDLARGMLCLQDQVWGCSECESCKLLENFAHKFLQGETEDFEVYSEGDKKVFLYLACGHPDFIFVPPKGDSLKIDQIRGVKDFVPTKPALSPRKVIILDKADLMTLEASNALLKTLEEPQIQTHFILTAPSRESLLPTVASRCYTLTLSPLPKDVFFELTGLRDEKLYVLSGGSPSKATIFNKIKDIYEALTSKDPAKVYGALQKVDGLSLREKEVILDALEEFLLSEGKAEATLRLSQVRSGLQRGVKLSLALANFLL